MFHVYSQWTFTLHSNNNMNKYQASYSSRVNMNDFKRRGGNKSLLMFCCQSTEQSGLLKSLFLYFTPGMEWLSIWVNKWLHAFIDISYLPSRFQPFKMKCSSLSLFMKEIFHSTEHIMMGELNSFDDEKSHWLILQELFLLHAEALCYWGNPYSISWNEKVLSTLMY